MSINLLSIPDLLALPEPEWLIETFIHQQEVGVLYGKPNGGKSFVALDWALSIATGTPWLGKYATRQGPVLYLAGEGGPSLQKRVDAWLFAHGMDGASTPVQFHVRPISLLDEEEIEAIQDVLGDTPHGEGDTYGPSRLSPSLIVVDTLSQFMMGGDENGPDMALFVSNLRKLSQDEFTAVLIVHHTNKGGEQERGHTALRGNVDVMFKVVGEEAPDGKLTGLTVTNDKQRDDVKGLPEKITTASSRRSLVLCLGKPSKLSPFIMILSSDSLTNLMVQGGKIEDVSKEVITSEEWRIESGLLPATFARHRNKLLSLKLIRAAGHGKYAFTPRGRETMYHYLKMGEMIDVGFASDPAPSPYKGGARRGREKRVRT